MPEASKTPSRLTREQIIRGAVSLADSIGLEALTIRKLCDSLGTKPMSIYHYVSGKEDIIDAMVGMVFEEVGLPDSTLEWKAAISKRARAMRAALRRHPWAIPIMESRPKPGIDILAHHEAMLACWLSTGFPLAVIANGIAAVDAFVYGFAIQENALPLGGNLPEGGDLTEASKQIISPLSPEQYPHLVRFTADHVMQPKYNFGDSFEPGLQYILEGVEKAART